MIYSPRTVQSINVLNVNVWILFFHKILKFGQPLKYITKENKRNELKIYSSGDVKTLIIEYYNII
jgi:hypothetical protein